jgi:hypothetical protein
MLEVSFQPSELLFYKVDDTARKFAVVELDSLEIYNPSSFKLRGCLKLFASTN